jgi:hypothetical protein
MESEAEGDVRSHDADEDDDQGPLTSRDENPIAMSALDSASRPRATQAERLQATTNPNLNNPTTPTSLMNNTDSTHVDSVKILMLYHDDIILSKANSRATRSQD